METYMTPQPPVYYDPNKQIQVGFFDAVQRYFKNYANFNGRSSRSEYWWAFLFTVILGWCVAYLGEVVSGIVGVLLIIPNLAISWRRMHDIGKGGGWWFINFVPLVGWIFWLVWCCRSSEPVANRFGAVPNMPEDMQ